MKLTGMVSLSVALVMLLGACGGGGRDKDGLDDLSLQPPEVTGGEDSANPPPEAAPDASTRVVSRFGTAKFGAARFGR